MGFRSHPSRDRSIGAEYYVELLRGRFTGRPVILAYGPLAVIGADVERVRALGAADVFVLADSYGTGTGAIDFRYRVVGPKAAANLMEGLRGFEAAVADLDADVLAELDAFDPHREALVLRPIWGSLLEVAGRPVYNARQPAWVALEDKVVIDALWDRAGVDRAPYRIVAADRASLEAAHRALDRGLGTVWAGDAREGWHGGAGLTRWVNGDDSAQRAAALLADYCDTARVMPFLEGIPCSIHGVVAGGEVAALRPVEMITLRDPAAVELRYFGTSTLWDPPAADREAMRDIARRVAALLRDEIDFRGFFSIDGVMTEDGFLPTELNPRFSAGLYRFMPGSPDLPLYFIDAAMCAGEPWDFRLESLARSIAAGADAHRVAVANGWDASRRDESSVTELRRDGRGFAIAGPGDEVVGSITSGPSPLGSFHKIALEPAPLGIGSSIGPHLLEVLALCDRELGTSFGALESARDVRQRERAISRRAISGVVSRA